MPQEGNTMKIIGHPLIPHQRFVKISTLEDIDHILPDAMIWWESTQDPSCAFAHFAQQHHIPYAISIQTLRELLIYVNLEAKYLIASKSSILAFQAILKDYVLDPLLLCKISDESEIEELALQGIDGVIFESLLHFDHPKMLNPTGEIP